MSIITTYPSDEQLLAKWRARLPPHADVDGFLAREAAIVQRLLASYRAQRGDQPANVDTWDAYTALVAALPSAERHLEEASDAPALTRLLKRAEKNATRHARFMDDIRECVDMRAESLILRNLGWDVVTMMTRSPVMVLLRTMGPVPQARGDFLVFWNHPLVAVKGAARDRHAGHGPQVNRKFKAAKFTWSPTRLRYERAASDDAWEAAMAVVAVLTPGAMWSTPTTKLLTAVTGLTYEDSYWVRPDGPQLRVPGPRASEDPFEPHVVLVRDSMGLVGHDPDRGLSSGRYVRHFQPDLARAEAAIAPFRDLIKIETPASPSELKTYAKKIWKMARAAR
jgi:hypothetical protein